MDWKGIRIPHACISLTIPGQILPETARYMFTSSPCVLSDDQVLI